MREIIIRLDGRMIGALWVRGRIEIGEIGIIAGPLARIETHFAPVFFDAHVTYEVKP